MTKREELTALKNKLTGLKSRIEADDKEAIAEGEKLNGEIEQKEAEIKEADKKAALLGKIGNMEKETEGTEMKETGTARTLGENFAQAVKAASFDKRFHISVPAFKAAADPMTSPAGAVGYATHYDRNVVTGPRQALVVRDLFAAEEITGSTLVYLVEGAMEGDFDVVAEGGQKPQIHFADPVLKTVSLAKVAAFIKESDEYIHDYKFLSSAVNGRLTYQLGLKVQNKLVADLLATSGIQTDSSTWTGSTKANELADLILKAAMDASDASGFATDAILLNPAVWYMLRVAKNANEEYYGGGFFGAQNVPNLWGIPVCVSPSIAADKIMVGAFGTCGSVVANAEGVAVEATNSNEDDFEKNLMTIRAEERLALAIRRPAGFKLISK